MKKGKAVSVVIYFLGVTLIKLCYLWMLLLRCVERISFRKRR